MRRLLLLTLAATLPRLAASAQAPSSAHPHPTPTVTLPASNHPVLLDVVVTSHDGHPVRGLKLSDFHLTDGNIPQTIHSFAEHSSLDPQPKSPPLPTLPPGTFADYTPLPPNAPLNILLIDALNTPTNDPSYIRHQLQQYVDHASPGTRLAILGLANRLILLQGFTSDPSILRSAVEHKLIPREPTLLDPSSANPAFGPSPTDIAANLREFEDEAGALETGFRTQFTLDALNTLAHYLAAFPGRKNVIWLSSSFPFTTLPQPSQPTASAIDPNASDELRETINLLEKAQVSIDPLDAASLISQPAYQASHPDHPTHLTDDLKKFHQTQADERTSMEQLATSTGGRAFYQPTSLATAVAQAIDTSANFYTLAFTPTNPTQPGAYRQLHITLSAPDSPIQPQLAYWHGYYAPSPASPDPGRARAYENATMSRGEPTPQDLFFKVRVLPASSQLETAVAPENQLDPDVSPKGPFQRFDIDFVALPSELTFIPQANSKHSASVEFIAYVFDADGRPLNATGKTVSFTATPANLPQLLHSVMQCHLELSVPDRQETFLRIGIRDVPSNKFGVIELPTADVSHLPPAVYPHRPAPASQPTPSPTPPAGRSIPPQE